MEEENMSALTCDICGGNLAMNESGDFAVCESCGMKHTKERVKVKVQEVKGTVTIEGVVETRVSDFTIRGGLLERYNGESLVVTIPNNVKVIGYRAFSNCSAIQEIILPNSVTKIESQAFSYCKELRKISIPDSVTVIEGFAFEYCENLETIELPDSIIDLGKDHNTWNEGGTFYRCSNLKTIKLSKAISVIRKDTFKDCSQLEYIEIPNGCVHIEAGAFENCANLKSVKIPHNIEKISGSWSYGSNKGAFANCQSLEKVEINSGTITEYAFHNCSRLKTVVIGPNVASIDVVAFSRCENIEDITILSPTINENIFKNTIWYKMRYKKSIEEVQQLISNILDHEIVLKEIITKLSDDKIRIASYNWETEFSYKIRKIDAFGVEYTVTYKWNSSRKEETQKAAFKFTAKFNDVLLVLRKYSDKCAHCGGEFKGVFKKVCSKCGNPKDY